MGVLECRWLAKAPLALRSLCEPESSLPLPALKSSKRSTVMVMSSVRTSYWSHSLYASATTFLHALSGASSPLNVATASITCCEVMNSHTPSDAITTNLSLSVICRMSCSGSAKTPIFSATPYPMERVNAHPGLCASERASE